MFNKVISDRFLRSNHIAGIECVFHSTDEVMFRGVILEKKKNLVSVKSTLEELSTEENLFRFIDHSIPVALVVSGETLIHRKILINESDDDRSILQKILPNANADNFYLQKVLGRGGHSWISVIRKDVLDQLLNKFYEKGYFIVNCSFGPFGVESILPFMQVDDEEFNLGNFKVQIAQQKFQDVEIKSNRQEDFEKIFLVGGEKIKGFILIPFASAFVYFIGNHFIQETVSSIKQSNEEYHQKKKFQFYGWSTMILFFVLLLVNYFIFSFYSEQNNKYQAEITLNQDNLRRFIYLQNKIGERQMMLESTGLLDASKTSFYADQLAYDLPNSILLTDLNVQPFSKKTGMEEEKIAFTPKVILVSGNCQRNNELNNWIKLLKVKDWVKDIAIVNFSQDKEERVGKFSLEVKIK